MDVTKYLNAVYVFSSMDDGDYFRVLCAISTIAFKMNRSKILGNNA